MSQTNKPTINPYLDARQEWNERYGSHIKQAKMWRALAFVALGLASICVIGVLYQASKSKLVPYVVEVDKLGTTLATKRAEEAQPADHRVIRAALASFIRNVRSVSPDTAMQKTALLDAYTYLSQSDPATAALNEYFSKNSPFDRAQTETVSIEINQLLPITKDTWQIEWTETVRTRKGPIKEVTRWKATASMYIAAPTNEADILRNPLGIFFREYTCSKQF